MPIYFKVQARQKPGTQDPEHLKYYAREINFGLIDTNRIAENIAKRSGHSVGQLIGFFQDYYRRIENHIVSGNNVSMAPLGTIIPAFASTGVATEKEVEVANIKNIHLNFRCCKSLRNKMQPKGTSYGEVELKMWK